MRINNGIENHHRSLASIVTEFKNEILEFLETRLALLKAELGGKLHTVRSIAPMALVGITFAGTAYLLFTLALVTLIAAFLPDSAFRWSMSFAAVGILWTLAAGIFLNVARRRLATNKFLPEKTIEVLRNDKVWLQQEARNQL